ncbi:MAG: hypothetical protein ACRD0W_15280 [Acidimicrobiales bacterium]
MLIRVREFAAESGSVTSIDVVNLAIAILAFGLAVGSLVWQFALYRLTGGRVKLEPIQGLAHISGSDLISYPAGGLPPDSLERLAARGYSRRVIGVTVRNVGRLPVTITGWSLVIAPTGALYRPLGAALGPPLDHRLEQGSSATWAADSAVVRAAASAQLKGRGRHSFRVKVELGDGRTFQTPRQPMPES